MIHRARVFTVGHGPVVEGEEPKLTAHQRAPPRLLCHRSERPYDTRARKRDELAPPHDQACGTRSLALPLWGCEMVALGQRR